MVEHQVPTNVGPDRDCMNVACDWVVVLIDLVARQGPPGDSHSTTEHPPCDGDHFV